jgi:hypothetical protein
VRPGATDKPVVVSNRFSIGFTNEYQLPLFDRFPLTIEFQRRLDLITETIARLSPEQLATPTHTMIEGLVGNSYIEPLELFTNRSWVRVQEDETLGGGGWYLAGMGYAGDCELWRMNPGVPGGFPEGEFFRGELITVVEARSLALALEYFEENWAQIDAILSVQRLQIEQFNAGLAEYAGRTFEQRAALRRRYN